MVYFVPFEGWGTFIANFDTSRLLAIKEKIAAEKDNFYWEALLGKTVD